MSVTCAKGQVGLLVEMHPLGRNGGEPGIGSVVFFFFFFLFFLGFTAANFLETLIERASAEEVGRQIRIVFAGVEENLAGATAVAVLRDLHGSAHAVHQLEVCVDVGFDVAAVVRFICCGDHGAHQ